MGKQSSAQNDPMVGFAGIMQAQAAQAQVQLGQNWLDFAEEQFAVGNKRQEKIDALTELILIPWPVRIPRLNCPYQTQPHQIQQPLL